jgi:hypothetical protein
VNDSVTPASAKRMPCSCPTAAEEWQSNGQGTRCDLAMWLLHQLHVTQVVYMFVTSRPDGFLHYLQVRRWPLGLFSTPSLIDAVVGRMKRGGPGSDTRELWLLLSHLYESQV